MVSFLSIGIVLELSPETKKLVEKVFSNDEYSFSKQVTLVEILKPPSQLSSNNSLKSKFRAKSMLVTHEAYGMPPRHVGDKIYRST